MHTRDQESILITTLTEGHTITAACKRAGVSRMFYDRHYKSDLEFRTRVDQARAAGGNTNDDLIDTVYLKKLREGSWPAIHYALKKKHREESKIPKAEFGVSDVRTIINGLPEPQQAKYQGFLTDLLYDATIASQAENPNSYDL